MAFHIEDDKLLEIIRDKKPDIVMATAITPMIYKAQSTLKIAKEAAPRAVTILGGIHPTFMYGQVLSEAPWIDYIVRGEGEEIIVELLRAIDAGTDKADRPDISGIAYLEDGKLVATPARPVIADLDTLTPDWSMFEVGQVHLHPARTAASRCPTSPAAARSRAASARSGSSGANTAPAIPRSSSTRSRIWSAITTSASSSSPTKSRPSIARSS